MIKTDDAIRIARAQIGTPYTDLDCINLIKRVIRTAPGGDPSYTTAGTNALWNSFNMSPKYKDLTWRREGLSGAQAGMLAFKADRNDYHHVGLVTRNGTIIHASSGRGKTVETPLTAAEGWTHIAQHRHIAIAADVAENAPEDKPIAGAEMQVVLSNPSSHLNVRNAPDGDDIGDLHHGDVVEVLTGGAEWSFIRHSGGSGYVASRYLAPYVRIDPPDQEEPENEMTMLRRSDGTLIELAGRWEIVID